MYFNIYSDSGLEIRGYLVPDGFSAEPEVVVKVNGVFAAQVKCDQYMEGPYNQRLHATGVVGFILDYNDIPGLSATYDVEVSDAETGLVIYRRFDPSRYIEKRVFRLETHFAPHHELDQSLAPYFQFHINAMERYGGETARQALEVLHQPSTYASGRILIKRYQAYLSEESLTIVSLEDPFVEMAARLSIVSQMNKRHYNMLPERDAIMFRPAIDHFADLDLSNERAVRARLKSASKDVLGLFCSPLTHQLSAMSPTDVVQRDSLASALDLLSQFTLFNAGGDAGRFAQDIAELIGLPRETVNMRDVSETYGEMAEMLRNIKFLEHLLESDLIMYHFVKRAEKRALHMVMDTLNE